jgi:predicted Fe-Mo cluster-binding NifX family protein
MKIAIPVANDMICMHFGHCEQFYVYDVDTDNKTILGVDKITPPPHEPGLLPRWLKEKNVDAIIAGGMGQRAQQLFAERDIKVFVGAPVAEPKTLVETYLEGNLVSGENACDH